MRALLAIPFCPYDGRWVSLGYLSAVCRYTADGPGEQIVAGHRHGQSHAGHGPTRGPSGGAGVGPRLRPAVPHRWVQGVSDSLADPLWAVGAAPTTPKHRPHAQAALDAPAWSALRAGGQ